MQPISVLVIDRERLVAQAIAESLDGELEIVVVGTARSVLEATESRSGREHVDVIVLDESAGVGTLAENAARLRTPHPDAKFVVTSRADDAVAACESVRAGASAFVSKVAPMADMIRAVRGAAHGESWIPPLLLTGVLAELTSAPRAPREDPRIRKLTERERQVLQCMMTGFDRARIAEELVLSINTIRTHTQNILAKLDVHSSLEAVSLALQVGFRNAPRGEPVAAPG